MKNIFLVVITLIAFQINASAQDARTIINNMTTAVAKGKTFEYTMKQTERINGVNYTNKIFTKVSLSPLKIYINNIEGDNEGKELIYVKGERSDKVYINVLFGVALSPFNSKVRKNQHHTILESGFGLLLSAIKDAVKRADAESKFDEVFTYKGMVTFDGKSCYKMELNDPTFAYVDYTIKSGETLYSIAIKKNICEQLIIENNSTLSGFSSGSEGMVIKIPSSYAKKTILYIDKATSYPIYQEMYDDKGLFEKYEFYGLKINPTFTDLDFSDDNDAYNF